VRVRRCCEWHRSLGYFCNDMREREKRAVWIAQVRHRLGLIGSGDIPSLRMAQWEADRESPPGDLPVAFCAKGRELDTALTLELHGERVAEIRGHPYLIGTETWLARVPDTFPDTGWLYEPDPVPWPLTSYRCPGCLTTQFEGVFDPDSHYPFCWIAHPPLPPLNLGGLLSGI